MLNIHNIEKALNELNFDNMLRKELVELEVSQVAE